MAINPIALQTKAADFGGALNTLAAVRQLQAAGQQRQMNELAIQEAQRKQAENQALSKALSQYDIGTPEGLNALRRIGPKGFEYASAVEKMRQEAQTAKKSALKTDLDLFSKAAGGMADSPENYSFLYQGAIKDNPELASYLPSPQQYQPGLMQNLSVDPEARFRRETAMKTLEGQQSMAQQRMQSADERARLNREAQEEQNRLNREIRQQGIDLQRQQLEATTAQQRKRLTLDERKQRWAEKTEVPEFKKAMAAAETRGKDRKSVV